MKNKEMLFCLLMTSVWGSVAFGDANSDAIRNDLSSFSSGGLSLGGEGQINLPNMTSNTNEKSVHLSLTLTATQQRHNNAFLQAGTPTSGTFESNLSWGRSYYHNWKIGGDGWVNGEYIYNIQSDQLGNSNLTGGVYGTLLGQGAWLVHGNLYTRRDYRGTPSIFDDVITGSGTIQYLNSNFATLPSIEIPAGETREWASSYQYRSFFNQSWQYIIYIVPVTITAELGGNIGHGGAGVSFGYGPDTSGASVIHSNSWVTPGASIDVSGHVGLGHTSDARFSVVYGSVYAKLLRGNFELGSTSNARQRQACFEASLFEASTLSGQINSTVQVKVPVFTQVRQFVNQVCNNGFLDIPGCPQVEEIVRQFNHWSKTKYTKKIAGWSGYTISGRRSILNQCASI